MRKSATPAGTVVAKATKLGLKVTCTEDNGRDPRYVVRNRKKTIIGRPDGNVGALIWLDGFKAGKGNR